MNYAYEKQPALRRDFVLCEPGTHNVLSDRLNFIMLQLPCIEKDDIELLEDMIVSALKDAQKKATADKEKKLGKFGQGMSGLF